MSDPAPRVERRTDPRRRAIFVEAYALIEPFVDPSRTWGKSPLTVLAVRALRQEYPELSPQDVHVLVDAARRVSMARRAASNRQIASPAARVLELAE